MRTLHAIVLVALAGCAANVPGGDKPELAAPSFEDDAADSYTEALDERGPIAYGDTVEAEYAYFSYAGYSFTGRAGARVWMSLVGVDNDPVLYLYGPKSGSTWASAARVAMSDDYNGLDSYLAVTLPADGTYLIVAEEFWGVPGSFILSLGCTGDSCSAAPPAPAPSRPSDCRASGCPTGRSCDFCWGSWQCVFDGWTC